MTPNPNKRSLYQEALSETLALITPNQSFITNLSLITAVIQSQFSFHWVGFYLIDESQNQLVLDPFRVLWPALTLPMDEVFAVPAGKRTKPWWSTMFTNLRVILPVVH